jgi:5-hydroxyisourate hydrolase
MKRISTHVLDLARGKPAVRVPVRLERRGEAGVWVVIATSQTDADGRCLQLLPESGEFGPGVYRLIFDTGNYQAEQRVEALYPEVEITFRVHEGDAHFHLPLLLSPHGYTTYRGT